MSDPRVDEIIEKLQEGGGRVTRTRRLVLDVLFGSDDHHLTVAEVVEGVRRHDPSFPESTVYRTLARLEELGVVTPLTPSGGVTYHVSTEPHVHATCDRCGAVFHHDADLLGAVAAELRDAHGFELDVHRTVVRGRCRRCAAEAGRDPSSPTAS